MEPIFDIIWDNGKANSNLAKHGLTFAQAATVMLDPLAMTVFDAAIVKQRALVYAWGGK